MFATVDRARPTRVATVVLGHAELVDELTGMRTPPPSGPRSSRWRFSTSASSSCSRSASWRTTPGSARARKLAGAEPSFAGDELVAVERLGHEDRLEDAVLR